GFIVVLGGYRLMPDGPYPAMLEDTARAIAWTHQNIAQYGGDPEQIVLAGHSAGAYNVVMTALEERWLADHGVPMSAIAGVVGLSGPYDFVPLDSESTIAAFGKAPDLSATQPANHLRADAPPVLLIHGEKDDLVGLHNSQGLSQKLRSAGVRAQLITYPAMTHNDPLISLAAPWRAGRDVKTQIAEFARRVATPQTAAAVSD
ncbi:MAG: alpha/beta hydrolase, partial [Pseudomonadota bacterium]